MAIMNHFSKMLLKALCMMLITTLILGIGLQPADAQELPDLTNDSLDPFAYALYTGENMYAERVNNPGFPTYFKWAPGEVRLIQRTLNSWLTSKGIQRQIGVDGIFGPETATAVKYFQYKSGLTMDGVVGPTTQKKLGLSGQLSEKYYFYNIDISTTQSETEYLIYTSLANKQVTVYQQIDFQWTPIGTVSCTIGKNSTPTPTGIFIVVAKKTNLKDWPNARYCTGIGDGIYFHTTLSRNETTGKNRSHGCIRLKEKYAKWLYENIPYNTTVIIDDRPSYAE